jgi:hypothetical protein
MPASVNRSALCLLAVAAGCFTAGCFGTPNQANILLRKENQDLHDQVSQLKTDKQMDANVIAGLQARIPTEPTLPPAELDKLYTTHGIRLGRLTGGMQMQPDKPGDQGLAVYVIPYDQSEQPFKAAGAITVEAFDLAAKDPFIGRWKFDLEQAKANWYGYFLIDYYYALSCPWQTLPQHPDLTVKVTFVDELTKLPFTTQTVVHVMLPPAPTTGPAAP